MDNGPVYCIWTDTDAISVDNMLQSGKLSTLRRFYNTEVTGLTIQNYAESEEEVFL